MTDRIIDCFYLWAIDCFYLWAIDIERGVEKQWNRGRDSESQAAPPHLLPRKFMRQYCNTERKYDQSERVGDPCVSVTAVCEDGISLNEAIRV